MENSLDYTIPVAIPRVDLKQRRRFNPEAKEQYVSIESHHAADQATKLPVLDLMDDTTESSVIHRAVEVIGDKAEAMRWLGTPIYALGYETPISRLHTIAGRQSVLTVLGRLEHGIA